VEEERQNWKLLAVSTDQMNETHQIDVMISKPIDYSVDTAPIE